MKTMNIQLTSIQDVRDFVDAVTGYGADVDLSSGRYTVDAKSIMGIFSLDLLKPIKMTVHGDNEEEIIAKLGKFIVE